MNLIDELTDGIKKDYPTMSSSLKKYIKLLFGVTLVATAISCHDNMDSPDSDNVEYGVPTSISISYSIGDMSVKTRADMAAGRDKEINSMWLGFFDKNSKQLKHQFEFPTQGNIEQIGSMDNDFGSLNNLTVFSGEYYIVAVANPRSNRGITESNRTSRDLMDLLKNEVKTYDDYKNIAVYSDPGTVGTPTGNLVMQGIFLPDGTSHDKNTISDFWSDQAEKTVVIHPKDNKLAGKLHFRRLISKITFNINKGNDVRSMEVISATIYNVPSLSWMSERSDGDAGNATTNAGDVMADQNSFSTSPNFYGSQIKVGDGYVLDWYQMENRRQAIIDVGSYSKREKQRQDNNLNNGIYTALCGETGNTNLNNNNASYLVINARIEVAPYNGANSTTADAVYTIHLGFCEGIDEAQRAKDFNCRRNFKYTYNVTIDGVDRIRVEAMSQAADADNFQHGAEGVITDVTNTFFTADSHYEQYNVNLTNAERSSLKWSIRAYYNQTEYYTITDENYTNYDPKYYNWIQFIPTSSATVPAVYNPDDVIPLIEMNDLQTHPNYNNNSNTSNTRDSYYTMFINEYVYEDANDEGNTTPSWKTYVNLPNRVMWLRVEEFRSTDNESVVYKSKYAVQQRSMQTYYGIGADDPEESIAVEHINEIEGTGLSVTTRSNLEGGGRKMTSSILNITATNNPSWDDFLSRTIYHNTTNQGILYINRSNNEIALDRACLNRNRDLNGDGQINLNELRWFNPSLRQYVRIVMGSRSLINELYRFSDHQQGSQASYFHYGSAEGNTLWAEEYMSTGGGNASISHVRCARYLGVDMRRLDVNPGQPAFRKRNSAGNIIDFYYGKESTRDFTTQPLPWHYVNSEYNRPAKAVEYKSNGDDIIALDAIKAWDDTKTLTIENWFAYLQSNNPCSKYNVGTESGWRVPNQVEMTAIMMLDNESIQKGGTRYLTATREYFSQGRVMGVVDDIATAIGNGYMYSYNRVRCVRDVER